MVNLFISNAYAEGSAPAGGGFEFLIMIGIFFAIMYFMIIRPQQKRTKEHADMLATLNKGNEVVTSGGVLGKVVKIGENFVEIKVSENSTLSIQKHAIASIMPKGTMKHL